jgi:hypothetical protein
MVDDMVERARVIGPLVAAMLLGGCDGFRETVGLEVPPPDEFLVISRQPLERPQSLDALPTPQLGAPSRVERDPTREARAALAGAGVPTAGEASAGEQALVARAGPGDPAVRAKLVAEAGSGERRFGLDSLFGFPIEQDPEAAAQRLEAEAEARRLRDAGVSAPVAPPVD